MPPANNNYPGYLVVFDNGQTARLPHKESTELARAIGGEGEVITTPEGFRIHIVPGDESEGHSIFPGPQGLMRRK